jgi:hypothetical protein
VAQLGHRLVFNLVDAFSDHAVNLPNLIERARFTADESIEAEQCQPSGRTAWPARIAGDPAAAPSPFTSEQFFGSPRLTSSTLSG